MSTINRDVLAQYKAVTPDCHSCIHRVVPQYPSSPSRCKIAEMQPIPVDFLSTGCNEWLYDEVPF